MRSAQPFRSLRVPAEEPSEHGHHHAAPDRHDDGNELHRNPREQKDQVQNAESHAHQSEKDERNRQVEQQNAKREDEKVQCAQPGFAAQVFGGDLAAGKPRRGRAGPAERGHEQPQAGRGRDCGCISHSHVGQQPKASLRPNLALPGRESFARPPCRGLGSDRRLRPGHGRAIRPLLCNASPRRAPRHERPTAPRHPGNGGTKERSPRQVSRASPSSPC